MKRTLSESQLSMWKTVIALIHADNLEHPDEIEFINDRINKLQLIDEQRSLLETEMKSPSSVQENFKNISEPKDRAHFIYFARLLLWSDGDFSEQERKIHQQLNEDVIDKVDLREVMRKLDDIKADISEQEEKQKQNQPLHRKVINALVFWDDLDVAD